MAVTFEFGKCAWCGENNSKVLRSCRACGADLPWTKALAPTAIEPEADAAPPLVVTRLAKPKIGWSDLAYGPVAVQLLGGLIGAIGVFFLFNNSFRFYHTRPTWEVALIFLGAALWRFGQNME